LQRLNCKEAQGRANKRKKDVAFLKRVCMVLFRNPQHFTHMHSYKIKAYSRTDARASVNAIYASAIRKGDSLVSLPVKDVANNPLATQEAVQSALKQALAVMQMRNAWAAANRAEARAMSRRFRRSR
jgi:methionine synthase II (cobalamin-independent)